MIDDGRLCTPRANMQLDRKNARGLASVPCEKGQIRPPTPYDDVLAYVFEKKTQILPSGRLLSRLGPGSRKNCPERGGYRGKAVVGAIPVSREIVLLPS